MRAAIRRPTPEATLPEVEITPTDQPFLGPMMREVEVDPGSWEELSACQVCGGSDALVDLAAVEASATGALVTVCLDCEHFFKRRRPTSSWLDHYYAQDWDQQGKPTTKRVKARPKVLDFCDEHLPDGARVLDMGAGFGRDALAFQEAGYVAHALEASEHRAAYINDVLGIPCLTSPFETADLPEGLDLIFSNHVMEHITEPADVIRRAAEVLDEGGFFYAALPNCLTFEHAVQFLHYAPHQSGFSLRSFTRLLNQHGFEVVKSVVTRELKVLARRTAAPIEPEADGNGQRAASRRAAEAWVREAFGPDAGDKTLVWWRPSSRPNRCYDGTVVKGSARVYRLLRRSRDLYAKLPKPLHRRSQKVLPDYVYKNQVRMLHVRSSGQFELPVKVTYDTDGAPIWVK
jgi:SAM-dependent methyltransferase